VLIDQGEQDEFLEAGQLRPEALEEVAEAVGQALSLRRRAGDHSYYFVSSYIADHLAWHAARLRVKAKEEREAAAAAVRKHTQQPHPTTPPPPAQPIVCKAMVAHAPKQPLKCEMVTVAPPKAGEVRIKVVANALCHTDVYTWEGSLPLLFIPLYLARASAPLVLVSLSLSLSLSLHRALPPCGHLRRWL
jgi:S-(hydroxymethyl)glutathione dehydrogenase/alcohol dehydrogenase